MQSVTLNLFARHTENRLELSEQTMHAFGRNGPDAEEAENVVDAVSVEILLHVLESSFPPFTSVADHPLPVVRWESPVLTVFRERVWRGARLRIEVEIFGFVPHIAAVAVDADGDVAFQNYAASLGILVSRAHLTVEDVLHEIEESHVLVCL